MKSKLLIIALIALVPNMVSAANGVFGGSYGTGCDSDDINKCGKKFHPWIVEDCTDLQAVAFPDIANTPNEVIDHYLLGGNIDCSMTNPSHPDFAGSVFDKYEVGGVGIEYFTGMVLQEKSLPISLIEAEDSGYLNGNGYTVDGIYTEDDAIATLRLEWENIEFSNVEIAYSGTARLFKNLWSDTVTPRLYKVKVSAQGDIGHIGMPSQNSQFEIDTTSATLGLINRHTGFILKVVGAPAFGLPNSVPAGLSGIVRGDVEVNITADGRHDVVFSSDATCTSEPLCTNMGWPNAQVVSEATLADASSQYYIDEGYYGSGSVSSLGGYPDYPLPTYSQGADGPELILYTKDRTESALNANPTVFSGGIYESGCDVDDRELCGTGFNRWYIRTCEEFYQLGLADYNPQLNNGTGVVYADQSTRTFMMDNFGGEFQPHASEFFELTNDIDCTGYNLKPLSDDNLYTNGYKISNVTINRPTEDNVGIYANLPMKSSEKFHIENCTVIGNNNVGCLAGTAERFSAGLSLNETRIIIENPVISGSTNVGGVFGNLTEEISLNAMMTIGGTVQGENSVGSLVGKSDETVLMNAISSTDVIATGTSSDYIGGMIGKSDGAINAPSNFQFYYGQVSPGTATNKGNMTGSNNYRANDYASSVGGYSLNNCSGCTDDWSIANANQSQAQSLLTNPCFYSERNITNSIDFASETCPSALVTLLGHGPSGKYIDEEVIYVEDDNEFYTHTYGPGDSFNLIMDPTKYGGYAMVYGLDSYISYDQRAPFRVSPVLPRDEQIDYGSNDITIRYFDPNLDDTVDVEFEFHSTDDAATCGSTTPSETDTYNATTDVGLHTFTVSETLVTGTTYYWCARATDNNGNVGAWSDLYSFTFGTPVPADPNELPEIINVIPVDEATDEAIDSAVEIDYDDLDVADQVSVELNMYHGAEVTNCDSPGAASSVAFDEGSPQTNNDNSGSVVFTPSIDLTNSTTYYICTRASDDKGGVSSWILTSFTTKEANVPPTLGSFPTPADGALDQDASLSLEIDYSDSNSFDTVNLTARVYSGEPDCSAGLAVGHDQQLTYDVDSNSGTASFPVAGLPEGRTYYWCVEASDGIESSYRGPFSFSTATSGPAPGSIESVMGYYSEAAVTVVDLENTVTVFDENTPAGVNISAKIPGAEVGVCNVKGQLVDLTFVAPGVSADIHCHEDSFYVGNIVGFAPGAPAVLVSFDGVTGEGKTNINGLVKQGKSGIGGQILVGGQFLAIDPPGTWIFELDGVEDFIMNEGEANEFTVASIIDNTAFTVSENTDGTQSIIVASGTVTVTDSQGTDIVVDGGTQGDNNAEAIVLTRNATQDLTVGSGGVITLTGGVEIPDRDGDLVPDNIDTCINVHNTDQTDTRGCGAEGLYHSFARQETRSYRESFFNNMKGSDLTEALNPQGKSTNKTVGYLREMVKRAANQSTEIKAAAVAANALLNLTGEDQIDETDGSNDTLYQVLKKVRQWRFENR